MTKKQIIVHCSDTPPSMDIGAKDITRWHTDSPPNGNGWRAIAYAKIIRRDGTIENGRDLDNDGDVYEEVGAHAAGHNSDSIGICLVGGRKEGNKEAEANFTFAQYESLMLVIMEIWAIYGIIPVIGHRDVSNKPCPSFNVKAFMEHFNKG